MQIIYSPIRCDATLSLERLGDVLTLNGATLDLSGVTEGATLPEGAIISPWINGDVSRADGVLSVTVALSHGENAPEETRFPEPVTLSADGPVTLPAWGENAPDPVMSDSAIAVDWSQLVTAEDKAAAGLHSIREAASLSLGDFAVNAAQLGYITLEEAEAWAISNQLPAQLQAALALIPDEEDRLKARVSLAKPTEPIARLAPRLPFVAQAFGVPADQVDAALDALFGIA